MAPLRFAVPNKGVLTKDSTQILSDAGYRVIRSGRELVLNDSVNNVQFFFLRPRDIAIYVGQGSLDIGITGRDLLLDSMVDAKEILALEFGKATFRFAAPPAAFSSLTELDGKRIASSYPNLVKSYLDEWGIRAQLVKLDGAVETAVQLGVADAVADVVETGTTLKTSGLEVFGEPVLASEAILIQGGRVAQSPDIGQAIEVLYRRLQGVLIARRYVILDFDCPISAQDAAFALAPGIESPTVAPLAREGWLAVRTLVPRSQAPAIMDKLWTIGARAILASSLDTCRI